MEELVQLFWFVLCCSANSCQSFSSCLHLQVWDFFWRLSEWKYYHRHFLKVGVDSGKMVLPISLSTARWMTATVYAWNPFKKNKSILLASSVDFWQGFPCSFQFGPMQLKQNRKILLLWQQAPHERRFENSCVFFQHWNLWIFIISFRVVKNHIVVTFFFFNLFIFSWSCSMDDDDNNNNYYFKVQCHYCRIL